MACCIPEIRIYSPSDHGDSNENSNADSSNGNNKNELDDALGSQCVNNENDCGNKVAWENTFHMRTYNLSNFPNHNPSSYRSAYRSQSVSIHRARLGCTTSPAKSLNILRQTLQNSINREINNVMQRYLDQFFKPAIENIKNNNGANSVSEQHIQNICKQVLEEAKKMYCNSSGNNNTRCNSPAFGVNGGVNESGMSDNDIHLSLNDNKISTRKRVNNNNNSDSDSEASNSLNTLKPNIPRKKKIAKHISSALSSAHSSGRSTPSKTQHVAKSNLNEGIIREGPKWDHNRLSTDTLFVLGSRANKALGFGTTRGRLYTKHADLFRYIGDIEDKQWLHDNHLMPPAGGKAYLLIKEDILDLIESNEYNSAPGVNANDMGKGFTVPQSMINKMKTLMQAMRNSEGSRKKIESKSKTVTVLNPPSAATSATGDNSSTGSVIDHSNQPSVETLTRPESVGYSPVDDLGSLSAAELPSTNASPFSLKCFESPCEVSPDMQLNVSDCNT